VAEDDMPAKATRKPAKARRSAGKVPPLVPKRRRKLTVAEREAVNARLLKLREKRLAEGDTLDSWEELMQEVADRRGGASRLIP
jgi:hypothetical protein